MFDTFLIRQRLQGMFHIITVNMNILNHRIRVVVNNGEGVNRGINIGLEIPFDNLVPRASSLLYAKSDLNVEREEALGTRLTIWLFFHGDTHVREMVEKRLVLYLYAKPY